jgi:toxin secretion/phage lysis holin
MKKEIAIMIQTTLAGVGAFLSAKLGILFPVLCILAVMMFIDYISGMLASQVESLDHPDDKNYGWNSKKGAKGIIKKFGYISTIAVAMVIDYVIVSVSAKLNIKMPATALFGLLVTVWYILNESLSIIENAGRMGAPVPEWLRKYIAVLKDKIDKQVE